MLDCLGLGTVGVGGNQKESSVHYSCSGQHSGEEDLVARAVAEGDVALQDQGGLAAFVVAVRVVLLVRGEGLETIGGRAGRALEYFGIGVA